MSRISFWRPFKKGELSSTFLTLKALKAMGTQKSETNLFRKKTKMLKETDRYRAY
jgi:hypothetical protein